MVVGYKKECLMDVTAIPDSTHNALK